MAITANGYEDLSFKFVVDQNGTISLQPDDGQGDPYELHVKIDGSFEAAIVGQKKIMTEYPVRVLVGHRAIRTVP